MLPPLQTHGIENRPRHDRETIRIVDDVVWDSEVGQLEDALDLARLTTTDLAADLCPSVGGSLNRLSLFHP
jgi:hypothetical protein